MDNPPELTRLRAAMDDINHRLTDILHERARLARKIGTIKHATGMTISDPEREQAMLLEMLRDAPTDGFSPESLEVILRTVLEVSRAVVASPRG